MSTKLAALKLTIVMWQQFCQYFLPNLNNREFNFFILNMGCNLHREWIYEKNIMVYQRDTYNSLALLWYRNALSFSHSYTLSTTLAMLWTSVYSCYSCKWINATLIDIGTGQTIWYIQIEHMTSVIEWINRKWYLILMLQSLISLNVMEAIQLMIRELNFNFYYTVLTVSLHYIQSQVQFYKLS